MCRWLVTEFMPAHGVTGAAECLCKVSTSRKSVGCDMDHQFWCNNFLGILAQQ